MDFWMPQTVNTDDDAILLNKHFCLREYGWVEDWVTEKAPLKEAKCLWLYAMRAQAVAILAN